MSLQRPEMAFERPSSKAGTRSGPDGGPSDPAVLGGRYTRLIIDHIPSQSVAPQPPSPPASPCPSPNSGRGAPRTNRLVGIRPVGTRPSRSPSPRIGGRGWGMRAADRDGGAARLCWILRHPRPRRQGRPPDDRRAALAGASQWPGAASGAASGAAPSKIRMSTRRFRARPCRVELSAMVAGRPRV